MARTTFRMRRGGIAAAPGPEERPRAPADGWGGGVEGGAASRISAADCTLPASAPRRDSACMPRYPAAAGATKGAAAILGRCVADATSGCHGSSYEYLS